jgi:hypothetical protein
MLSEELSIHLLTFKIVRLFQKEYSVSDAAFIQLDKQYHILDYIEGEYPYFHLQGLRGCLIELVTMLKEAGWTC